MMCYVKIARLKRSFRDPHAANFSIMSLIADAVTRFL